MPKFAKPWFRPQRGVWYVTRDGKQINLGADRASAFQEYARLIAEPRSREVRSGSLASVVDAFLEWVQRQRSPDTYEWYRYRLERFVRKHPDLQAADALVARNSPQWKRINELKAYRSRSTRAATCLIVSSDADDNTVVERIQTFRDMRAETGVAFRNEGEHVAFIIPRRNIETWLAYLRGEAVNEVEGYRKYGFESECRDQVVRLDEMCRQQKLEPQPPPSLETACIEFKRIAK